MKESDPNALSEAIAFLKKQKPVQALAWRASIHNACVEHSNDIGQTGEVGHVSADGTTALKRLRRHCYSGCSENIAVKHNEANKIVAQMVVD